MDQLTLQWTVNEWREERQWKRSKPFFFVQLIQRSWRETENWEMKTVYPRKELELIDCIGF